jgi:hypothetical protein
VGSLWDCVLRPPEGATWNATTTSAVWLSKGEQREQARGRNVIVTPNLKGKVPEFLRTSPMSLLCPTCMSMPGRDCITTKGGLAAIHVTRIKADALADKEKKSNGGRGGHR